jgi:hypothetical protein
LVALALLLALGLTASALGSLDRTRPKPGTCKALVKPDAQYPTTEWKMTTKCTKKVKKTITTFTTGMSISAFLPQSCSANANVLTCDNLNIAAGKPFDTNVRFAMPFSAGAAFIMTVTFVNGTATTFHLTGP